MHQLPASFPQQPCEAGNMTDMSAKGETEAQGGGGLSLEDEILNPDLSVSHPRVATEDRGLVMYF